MAGISRIAVIGVSQVGAAAAYALVLGWVTIELLVVDDNINLRDSEVHDLSDVAYCNNADIHVRAASYEEASQCDIVIISAGSRAETDQTSIEYISRNISTVRTLFDNMKPFKSDTILLILTNPNDLLTSLAQKISGLPKSQVLGSGTFLDTMRLRGLIANKASVGVDSVDTYVLGVHGDSQIIPWSTATIDNNPITPELFNTFLDHTGFAIICSSKGVNPYGIGSIALSICYSILLDKRDVLPVSHYQKKFNFCFSLPAVIGRKGIISTIQLPLSNAEVAGIAKSAKTLKKTIDWIFWPS